jgi:hypothetical protein
MLDGPRGMCRFSIRLTVNVVSDFCTSLSWTFGSALPHPSEPWVFGIYVHFPCIQEFRLPVPSPLPAACHLAVLLPRVSSGFRSLPPPVHLRLVGPPSDPPPPSPFPSGSSLRIPGCPASRVPHRPSVPFGRVRALTCVLIPPPSALESVFPPHIALDMHESDGTGPGSCLPWLMGAWG